MLTLVTRIQFLFSGHRFNHPLLLYCSARSFSSFSDYHKDRAAQSELNQFIIYHFSWKLSHQPHQPNISRTSRFQPEEQNINDDLSVNNWDSWFQTTQSSLLFQPTSLTKPQLPEFLFPQNSSSFTPMTKRPLESSHVPSTRKPFQYDESSTRHRNLPQRFWTTIDSDDRLQRSRREHFSFRVINYNILAQQLIDDHRNLYIKCSEDHLNWHERKHRLLGEILSQNADIICLQEMQHSHYNEDFRPRMSDYGYDSIYMKRTGYKSDGCCLFYKTNRLRLMRSVKVSFYQPNIEVLNRDNCGLIVLFQPLTSRSTGEDLFCVATTHLLFSPKRGDIKLAQIQYFLAEIDRISLKTDRTNSYCPIIICGDFNAQPQSPLSRFLTDGHIKYDEYRRIEISGQIPVSSSNYRFSLPLPSHNLLPASFVTSECRFPQSIRSFDTDQSTIHTDFNTTSAATLIHNKRFHSVYDLNDSSKVTTCIDDEPSLVDYIFYTKSSDNRSRLFLSSRYELYDEQLMSNVHMPNQQFPSDHFLLAAEFALKLHKRKLQN